MPTVRLRLAIMAVLTVPAVPAVAQEPGVTYDPSTPAGQEYAVPLDAARREAASTPPQSRGEGTAGVRGGRAAPLFGEGITSAAEAPEGGAGADGQGTTSDGSPSTGAEAGAEGASGSRSDQGVEGDDAAGDGNASGTAVPAQPSDGSRPPSQGLPGENDRLSVAAVGGGAGAIVLVAGLAVGFVLRWRRTR